MFAVNNANDSNETTAGDFLWPIDVANDFTDRNNIKKSSNIFKQSDTVNQPLPKFNFFLRGYTGFSELNTVGVKSLDSSLILKG